MGGSFTTYNSVTSQYIVKMDADGVRDATFDITSGFNSSVIAVRLDSNGKIYAGGGFTTYKGSAFNRIIRLNTDGSRDTGFDMGTGLNGACRVITIDNNGKIYLGGDFTTYNGGAANRIIRLNTDGTADTGFSSGTGFDGRVNAITVDASNNIYVGGNFFNYNGTAANGIIKLTSSGSIDTSFVYGTGFTRANERPMSTTPAVFNVSPTVGGYVIGFTRLENSAFRIYNKMLSDSEVANNWAAINDVGLPLKSGLPLATDLLFSVDSTRQRSYPLNSFINGTAYDPVDGSISMDGTDDYIDLSAYREYMFACTTAKSNGSITGLRQSMSGSRSPVMLLRREQ